MGGHGQPWVAMGSHGWPWAAMGGHRWPWAAMGGHGPHGRWVTLNGHPAIQPWPAMAGWPAMRPRTVNFFKSGHVAGWPDGRMAVGLPPIYHHFYHCLQA